MTVWDGAALVIFAVCYVCYPRLYGRARARGDRPLRADMFRELHQAAAADVESAEGRSLLMSAMQTHSRTLVFLATVSSLALGGGLGMFLNSERTMDLSSFSLVGVQGQTGVRLRLLVFVLLSGYAFLQFIWGMKALYNLSFALHTRRRETVLPYIQHLDLDVTSGLRTLYYLSVLFLWFFGAEFLVAGSAILTYMIYRYDFLKSRF